MSSSSYFVNDKITLIDGDRAIIKFIGKTALNDTKWFGIEYLSSKSILKPTLITIDDIKCNKNKKKSLISLKDKVDAALSKKSAKVKTRKSRSCSAPQTIISPTLSSLDINNTFAVITDLDDISSTIDSPLNKPTKKNKKKLTKKLNNNTKNKRKTKHMSDLKNGILSSPSLSVKKAKPIQKITALSLTSDNININFDDDHKTLDHDKQIILKSQTSSQFNFAALIEDNDDNGNNNNNKNNNILTEEKEIEDYPTVILNI